MSGLSTYRAFDSRTASGSILHVPEVVEPRHVADYYGPAHTEMGSKLAHDKREFNVEKK